MSTAYAQATDRERLTGVWRLHSLVRTFRDGRTEHPCGQEPIGRIQYEKTGRMMVLVMRPGRKSTIRPGAALSAAECDELREAVSGFIGYFGMYEVDEKAKTVTHRIAASLVPGWVNADLVRTFRFDGSRLILHRDDPDGSNYDELVWERESE